MTLHNAFLEIKHNSRSICKCSLFLEPNEAHELFKFTSFVCDAHAKWENRSPMSLNFGSSHFQGKVSDENMVEPIDLMSLAKDTIIQCVLPVETCTKNSTPEKIRGMFDNGSFLAKISILYTGQNQNKSQLFFWIQRKGERNKHRYISFTTKIGSTSVNGCITFLEGNGNTRY